MSSAALSQLTPEELEGLAKAAYSDNIGLQLGPLFLGCVFDFVLLGVMVQQFQSWWAYCKPTERKIIIGLTCYIMIASLSWTGMIISYALHNFVYNFGVFIVYLEMEYFTAFPIVGMGMSTAIQCFYIERSYRLNKRNPYLLVFLLALVVGEWATIIVLMVKVASVASLLQAAEAVPQVRAWQCMTLATDLMITISLGWGLWFAKTGWSHTDALVKKLLIVTLETQLAPTLMMVAFVIDLSVKPSSTIGIFFDILIPKSYTVGYLATLNTRVHLRRERSTHGSGNGKAADTNAYHLGTGRLQQATIKIDTETYTESFQIGRPTAGVNRRDMKDVSEEGSMENLDYASNLSKQNLNNPSGQF